MDCIPTLFVVTARNGGKPPVTRFRPSHREKFHRPENRRNLNSISLSNHLYYHRRYKILCAIRVGRSKPVFFCCALHHLPECEQYMHMRLIVLAQLCLLLTSRSCLNHNIAMGSLPNKKISRGWASAYDRQWRGNTSHTFCPFPIWPDRNAASTDPQSLRLPYGTSFCLRALNYIHAKW